MDHFGVYFPSGFYRGSGQGFDHGSCIVLGSIVEDSPVFCECGAVEV